MENTNTADLLPAFRQKWGDWVNPRLALMEMYQTRDHVYLRTGVMDDAGLTVVQEESLHFISEGEQPWVSAQLPFAENAQRMAALDGNSIIHCFDGLLTSAAEENILEYTGLGLTDEEARPGFGE